MNSLISNKGSDLNNNSETINLINDSLENSCKES
jgi:hypothetical protein